MQRITTCMVAVYIADVIYLDFCKAFDSDLCLTQSFCINSNLMVLLNLYGNGTELILPPNISIHTNIFSSDLVPVLSGVPQGSVLGPLLFALFINDLPSSVHFSKPFIYDDDTKCLRSSTRSLNLDTHPLQSDLNNHFTRSCTSQLHFNESKFAHIRFWSKQCTIYYVNGKPCSFISIDKIKDLGVLLSSSLSWDHHYNLILGKAYKILGLIRQTFSTT